MCWLARIALKSACKYAVRDNRVGGYVIQKACELIQMCPTGTPTGTATQESNEKR